MKIGIYCGDTFHPGQVVRQGLSWLPQAGVKIEWIEDTTNWQSTQLDGCDVVLLAKSNVCSASNPAPWLTEWSADPILRFVQNGGGLISVHSGTARYKDIGPMRRLLGGGFASHPPPGEVILTPKAGHPLTVGIAGAFGIHDEHYQMVVEDSRMEVFLTSQSGQSVQPAGWTRVEGQGRVVVLTPGHFLEVWQHSSYRQLLSNALCWVGDAQKHGQGDSLRLGS